MFFYKKMFLGIDVLEDSCRCVLYHPAQKNILAAQSFVRDDGLSESIRSWLAHYNVSRLQCFMSVPMQKALQHKLQVAEASSEQEVLAELQLYANDYFPNAKGDLLIDFYCKPNGGDYLHCNAFALERRAYLEFQKISDLIQNDSLYLLEPEQFALKRFVHCYSTIDEDVTTLVIYYVDRCLRYVLFNKQDLLESGLFYHQIDCFSEVASYLNELSLYLPEMAQQIIVFSTPDIEATLVEYCRVSFDKGALQASIIVDRHDYTSYAVAVGLVIADETN